MLWFFFGIASAAILYAFANFKESTLAIHSLPVILVISILFAILEYLVKIPTFYYHHHLFDPAQLQLIWIAATTLSVLLFQFIYLHKPIPFHTAISTILIFAILAVEAHFNTNK